MITSYSLWLGQAVLLHVEAGDMRVPLRGRLVAEGKHTLRVRIGEGWDVDIYKAMVLSVEEDAWSNQIT
jgi:hypothetical protein